jgi:hypothetical protein
MHHEGTKVTKESSLQMAPQAFRDGTFSWAQQCWSTSKSGRVKQLPRRHLQRIFRQPSFVCTSSLSFASFVTSW